MDPIERCPIELCAASLASWRLAHLLHAEDGPGHCLARLRHALSARQFDVLECFLCTSVWTALPAALLASRGRRQFALAWPALSAAAVLIERAVFPGTFLDVPEFCEDEEAADVLRQS